MATFTAKAFGDQHLARFRGGALARRIRIEAQDDLARESPELLRLLRRQRRAARRDDALEPAWYTCAKSK